MSAGETPRRPVLSMVADTGRDIAQRFAPPPPWHAKLQRKGDAPRVHPAIAKKRNFPPVPEGGAAIIALPAKPRESDPC